MGFNGASTFSSFLSDNNLPKYNETFNLNSKISLQHAQFLSQQILVQSMHAQILSIQKHDGHIQPIEPKKLDILLFRHVDFLYFELPLKFGFQFEFNFVTQSA